MSAEMWLGALAWADGSQMWSGIVLIRRLQAAPLATGVTWDCGYLRPASRMQYTSSSFAEMLVKLFRGVLRPHVDLPAINRSFPRAAHFASHVPETALELIFLPFLERAYHRVRVIRRLQHGQSHLYIMYILITLVVLIIWAQYA